MSVSKKLTDLVQAPAANASALLYLVLDPTGSPTSNSISVKGLLESNTTANLVANGSLVISGKALANVIVMAYSSTPANSTTVPVGFANNTMWSDGSYIYIVTSATQLKRVAIASW